MGKELDKAEKMVALYEEALAKGPGIRSVTVDGQTVVYDSPESIIKQLEYWRRQVVKTSGGRRSMFRGVNLGKCVVTTN